MKILNQKNIIKVSKKLDQTLKSTIIGQMFLHEDSVIPKVELCLLLLLLF